MGSAGSTPNKQRVIAKDAAGDDLYTDDNPANVRQRGLVSTGNTSTLSEIAPAPARTKPELVPVEIDPPPAIVIASMVEVDEALISTSGAEIVAPFETSASTVF